MNDFRFHVAIAVALFAAAPSALSGQRQTSDGWHLVFAVDSLGHRIEGDKNLLLSAVRSGQPVRVGWRISWKLPDGTTGGVEHVADAAVLTIHRDEVFAQLPPMLGQTPDARQPVITFRTEGDRLWYALLDTTGRLRGYFTGSAEQRVTRTATYWYVAGVGQGTH